VTAKRVDLLLRERSVERLATELLEVLPGFRTDVLVLELVLDPLQPVGIVQLGNEALRMLANHSRCYFPRPIVDLEVSVERGAPQAEVYLRVFLEARILQRGVELLVADLRELRPHAEYATWSLLRSPLRKYVIWFARWAGERGEAWIRTYSRDVRPRKARGCLPRCDS